MKKFEDGSTGLHWKDAKGRRAVNHQECAEAYFWWWVEWVLQEDLLSVLESASGLSDVFGKSGSVCQASVLWDIRNRKVML